MLNTNLQAMANEQKKSERPPLEGGTYPAIINMLVDLGEQRELKFGSQSEYQINRMLWIGTIMPTEEYEVEFDGETFTRYQVLGKQVKFSANEKSNLAVIHRALCDADSPVSDLLGQQSAVVVGHTRTGNPKITNFGKPMKGMSVKLPEGEQLIMVDESQWDDIDNVDLPQFLIDKIKDRVGGPGSDSE